MIPEKIKTRIYSGGLMRKQLKLIKQLKKEYPDSEYVKPVLKHFRQIFWCGTSRVNTISQIKLMKQLKKEYPDSEYVNSVLKQLRKKFWQSSQHISDVIFNEAWLRLFPEPFSEPIEIKGLKFIPDNAFKTEYSDIFIAGGSVDGQYSENEKIIASKVLSYLSEEGPYENELVKINKDDIVIDAGANLGLFSLLCFQKGAKKVYSFEPQKQVIKLLKKNIILNNANHVIEVVPLGLSDKNDNYLLRHFGCGHSAGSIVLRRDDFKGTEEIRCVTLDSWAKENNIPKIDFIKADVEGAERNMLLGSIDILKTFAPRLAICTYHLPDDPVVLEDIILKTNPNYMIQQTSHKLFAYVPQCKKSIP